MTIPEDPPAGLRWAGTSLARAITTIVAVIALGTSVALGVRQQAYISCVAGQQELAAARTEAVSAAADIERRAESRLIAGDPDPGAKAELRAQALAARAHTDRVRADNPPPEPRRC